MSASIVSILVAGLLLYAAPVVAQAENPASGPPHQQSDAAPSVSSEAAVPSHPDPDEATPEPSAGAAPAHGCCCKGADHHSSGTAAAEGCEMMSPKTQQDETAPSAPDAAHVHGT